MEVHVAGTWWKPEALREADVTHAGASVKHGIGFIQDWLAGKNSFSFKTSGSTGEPKTVSFSRTMLEASARISLRALSLQPRMNALVSLDTRFVAGAMMLVRALVGDLNLLLREPTSNPLHDESEPVDFLAVVPMQLTTLLREHPLALDRVRVVIVGGAPLPESVVASLQSKPTAYFATYGMTETLTHIALRKLNDPGRQKFFFPLPGVQVSADERGCLVIRAEHLGHTPILTNDLVTVMAEGSFRVWGRLDDVINTGGHKVHPRHVEDAVGRVLDSMGVSVRYFIAGKPDPILHEKVCLALESAPLSDSLEQQLLDKLKVTLNRFDVPREIVYRLPFPETPTQKIDKRAVMGI